MGASGWVVIDSGAPRVVVRTNPKAGTGNPTFMVLPDGDPDKETGLKSVDWWGPWRRHPADRGPRAGTAGSSAVSTARVRRGALGGT